MHRQHHMRMAIQGHCNCEDEEFMFRNLRGPNHLDFRTQNFEHSNTRSLHDDLRNAAQTLRIGHRLIAPELQRSRYHQCCLLMVY